MGLRFTLLASSFVLFFVVTPVHGATVWDHLDELPAIESDLIRFAGTAGQPCSADDLLCTLTCDLVQFEDGMAGPEVDTRGSNPKVVVPGPGKTSGGHVSVFGHWTICL